MGSPSFSPLDTRFHANTSISDHFASYSLLDGKPPFLASLYFTYIERDMSATPINATTATDIIPHLQPIVDIDAARLLALMPSIEPS